MKQDDVDDYDDDDDENEDEMRFWDHVCQTKGMAYKNKEAMTRKGYAFGPLLCQTQGILAGIHE